MILHFIYPNCFIPNEEEFKLYCAIKLLRGNYITEQEAIKICGYSSRQIFGEKANGFEERYKKTCDGPYADWVFLKDPVIE